MFAVGGVAPRRRPGRVVPRLDGFAVDRREREVEPTVRTRERLRQRGFVLFDIQFLTEHTARLGAVEISRRNYLWRLREALKETPTFAED